MLVYGRICIEGQAPQINRCWMWFLKVGSLRREETIVTLIIGYLPFIYSLFASDPFSESNEVSSVIIGSGEITG